MVHPIKQFEHLKITLEAIISATNNFADENCIGRGGFGKVYKGEIDNTMVALKRLDREFGQGDPEFWKEIMMLSVYKHENIVSLLGYCDDCGEKILMYEYLPKKSLDRYLKSSELSWVQRLKLCIGAARGLAFLHNPEGTQQRVLHRDIKSSNILLDVNWNAKISDFGLSKFGPANQKNTFLISHPVGTHGYCDPLYAETGFLTKESDVYSFGVVLCEVLCGRLCMVDDKLQPLVGLIRQSFRQNMVNQIVFTNIRDEINPNSLDVFSKVAYQCLKLERDERPLITEIVRGLEAALLCQVSEPSTSFSFSLPSPWDSSSYSSIKRSPPCRHFQFHEIQLATKSFDETLVVGKGGFGKVYKGKIFDGSKLVTAAIKRLDSIFSQGVWPEVEMLSTFRHCNIVSLIGYCNQGDEMILVYEYIPNGSLNDHLHRLGTPLSWLERLNICIDAGRGLHYLHTGVEVGVIHRDIKSSNVLLDESWTAKFGDFGLARIVPRNQTYVSDDVQGTLGYLDPDYFYTGKLTRKSDVYSFGVVLFEVLCRKPAVDSSLDEEQRILAIWATKSIKKGKLTQILDSDIRDQICPQSLKEFVRTAKACVHRDPKQRPTMAEALGSLEAALTLQEKFNNSLQPTPIKNLP
ncbi:kinase-like domain-containing protein [Tanacetum coccineum]